MTVLPSSLALTSIADGSNIVAADHRNNYTAVQTAVNALIADLGAGAAGQVLSGVGTTVSWVYPPGYEYDHAQVSTVATTNVTATTQGTATAVVTGNAVTYDGSTAVMLEGFISDMQPDTTVAGRRIIAGLFDNGTFVRVMGYSYSQVAGVAVIDSPFGKYKYTPTAGSHTFSIRCYVSAGTGVVGTGDGLGGNDSPAWLRVTKA